MDSEFKLSAVVNYAETKGNGVRDKMKAPDFDAILNRQCKVQ